jgi:hypothetical protein
MTLNNLRFFQVRRAGGWPEKGSVVNMGATLVREEAIRRSVSLPAELAEKIDAIAVSRHVTANRAIVDLLADAITAYEQRRTGLLNSLTVSRNLQIRPETKRLRKELVRMTFGG